MKLFYSGAACLKISPSTARNKRCYAINNLKALKNTSISHKSKKSTSLALEK